MSVAQPITAEQFLELPNTGNKRFELVAGEPVERPLFGYRVARIASQLTHLLDSYVNERRLGLTFMSGLGYILRRDPDTVRMATASFISWSSVPDTLPEGCWPGAPSLAVEIVSPDDLAEITHARIYDFLQAGTPLIWVVWPGSREVTAYMGDETIREYTMGDELDGGEVLPGFRVRVGELFEIPTRP